MKFVLEIELNSRVSTPAQVAEVLNDLHHMLREDGFGAGSGDINTRPYWRQGSDESELVSETVGKWELL